MGENSNLGAHRPAADRVLGPTAPEPVPVSAHSGDAPLRDGPSRHGKILGDAMADLAKAGAVGQPELLSVMCAGCAFRPGAMSNQMAATLKDALDCLLNDDEDFCCHHGMEDGEPTRLCAGYFAAQGAPFEVFKAAMQTVTARLAAATGPDEVRTSFNEWISKVDPEGKLDDYQRSRLFSRDRDGAEGGDANAAPVPQDRQARAEGIAHE